MTRAYVCRKSGRFELILAVLSLRLVVCLHTVSPRPPRERRPRANRELLLQTSGGLKATLKQDHRAVAGAVVENRGRSA
jgi:hypothetical protein